MLTIRREQLHLLEQTGEAALEARMAAHVAKFFPVQARALGPERLIQVVRDGRHRAARYGLVREREVFLFLDLMFALSFHFDEHPKAPWARRILTNTSMTTTQRMERLLRTTRCFFENVLANTDMSKTTSSGEQGQL